MARWCIRAGLYEKCRFEYLSLWMPVGALTLSNRKGTTMRRIQGFLNIALAGLALGLLQGQGCFPPAPDGGEDDSGCVELSGTISEDTTLDQSCYEITGSVEVVNNATLTIQPGVTLTFHEDCQMTISSGQLVAVGTAEAPIVFTGMETTPGYWAGLRFLDSNSLSNRLEYVTIEYGGGYWEANLLVQAGATGSTYLQVDHCTLRYSGAYGFVFSGNTAVPTFTNNTITGNASGAGNVDANLVRYLDGSSTYTANTPEIVRISTAAVNEDQTWPAIDVDYYVQSTIGLNITANLAISAGASFIFHDDDEKILVYGSLYAVGTSAQPIAMTAASQSPGGWGGLRYYNTNSTLNRLEYVTLSYGGGYYQANLDLSGAGIAPTQVTVQNCTFTNSAGYGVYWIPEYVTVNGDLAGDNTYSGNALGNVGTP